MPIWWGCWIAGNISANVSLQMAMRTADPEVFETSLIIGSVSDVLTILAAALLFQIVTQITRAQSNGLGVSHVFT